MDAHHVGQLGVRFDYVVQRYKRFRGFIKEITVPRPW
jgi:hypothetical protein